MYTIYAEVGDNEYLLHDPRKKRLVFGKPYFELADNLNGQAEFLVHPNHPYYSYVKKMTTEIVYYDDDDEVFRGRVLYDDEDMNGTKHVFVEGQLAYFNDSVQRPAVYRTSVSSYLQALLENHNAQVEDRKKFYLGRVTVTDPNNTIYRYSNWESTRKCLIEKLVNRLGGHFTITWGQDGLRYLNYLTDYDYYSDCEQPIKFGKNMLDYSKTITAADIATCVIPLGYRLPEEQQNPDLQEQRLTIESVNGGVDYVTDLDAVAEYGKIFTTAINDDITTAAYLQTWGENYLTTVQYERLVLELKAIDLGYINANMDRFEVGKRIHCISEHHGMDIWLPLSKMRVYLTDFSQNTITIGSEQAVASYTSSNRQSTGDLEKAIELLPTKKEILEQALRDATAMLNDYCTSGHAIHTPNEFIVADDEDPDRAQYLWRWGLGGLAHYSHGYDGPVDGVALTMEGEINGEMIKANSIYAASIDLGYRTSVTDAITTGDANVTTALENSITNAENRIKLFATSESVRMSRKEYVVDGEQETLDLTSFTVTGDAATVSAAQFLNLNCFKMEFSGSGTVYVEQDLGTLPAGQYYIEVTFAYPLDSDGLTTYRPGTLYYGFANNRTSVSLSGYAGDTMNTVKKAVEITNASKTISIGVNGTNGKMIYITNIRVLRDLTECIDDVSSELVVQADSIKSTVNRLYENVQHEYCLNPDFSNSEDYYAGWTRSDTTAVVRTTVDSKSCLKIQNGSSAYNARYQVKVPKACPFRVRFKAACASGHTSTARIRVGFDSSNKYTAAGDLTTSFQTFTFDFDNIGSGNKNMYIYNYVANTTIYVTDVEILGYGSGYYESQIIQNANEIATKVTANDVSSMITQSASSIRLQATQISWSSTYSSMTSTGVLTCESANIKGSITSLVGQKKIVMDNATIKSYYNNSLKGYLDLAANYPDGHGGYVYESVIGGSHDLYFEIGNSGTFSFRQVKQNEQRDICGTVDGNGFHGVFNGSTGQSGLSGSFDGEFDGTFEGSTSGNGIDGDFSGTFDGASTGTFSGDATGTFNGTGSFSGSVSVTNAFTGRVNTNDGSLIITNGIVTGFE